MKALRRPSSLSSLSSLLSLQLPPTPLPLFSLSKHTLHFFSPSLLLPPTSGTFFFFFFFFLFCAPPPLLFSSSPPSHPSNQPPPSRHRRARRGSVSPQEEETVSESERPLRASEGRREREELSLPFDAEQSKSERGIDERKSELRRRPTTATKFFAGFIIDFD